MTVAAPRPVPACVVGGPAIIPVGLLLAHRRCPMFNCPGRQELSLTTSN